MLAFQHYLGLVILKGNISPQSNVSIFLFIPVYQILCCPVKVATLVDQTKRKNTQILSTISLPTGIITRVRRGDVYCLEPRNRLRPVDRPQHILACNFCKQRWQ